MGKISNKKVGKNLLRTALLAGIITVPMINAKAAEVPEIKYSAHVEDHSWMKEVSSSDADAYAGTKHEARRMEALKIQLVGLDNVTLKFKAHIEDYGDREFTSADELIGTTGEAKRLEAITVWADGLEEAGYKLQYRVHIENEGDQDWRNAGEEAGSRGKAQRLESIQFRIVSKADEERETAKKDAIAQLEDQFKASDYTINKKDYDEKMMVAKEAINKAEDVAGVTTALKAAITSLSSVTSDKVELAGLEEIKNEAATQFVADLATAAGKADSVPAIKKAIESTRIAGTNLIDSANSATAVEAAVETAMNNAIKAARTTAEKELLALFNGKQEGETVVYLTADAYENAIKALKDETDVTKIVKAYTDALGTDNANLVSIEDIRSEAQDTIGNLDTAVKATDFADVSGIKTALDTAETAIENAETRSAIAKAVDTAKNTVLNLVKSSAKETVNKLYNDGKAVDCTMLSRTDYNKAITAIEKATAVDAVQTAVETAEDAMAPVTGAQEAINALKAIQAKADITSIIKEATETISQATTASKIAAAKEDAEAKILAAEKAYYVKEINAKSGKIDTVNSKYYTVAICNEVKAEINNASEFAELATIYATLETKASAAYNA